MVLDSSELPTVNNCRRIPAEWLEDQMPVESQCWEKQSNETEGTWQNDQCSASSWQSALCCLLEEFGILTGNSLKAQFWYSAMEGKNSQIKHWILPGEELVLWIINPNCAMLQPPWNGYGEPRGRERIKTRMRRAVTKLARQGWWNSLWKRSVQGKEAKSVFLVL